MAEHLTFNERVLGSNPSGVTKFIKMKRLLIICLCVSLISCDNQNTEIVIVGDQIDFTKDEIVLSDSVFLSNQRYIDSLMTLENETR